MHATVSPAFPAVNGLITLIGLAGQVSAPAATVANERAIAAKDADNVRIDIIFCSRKSGTSDPTWMRNPRFFTRTPTFISARNRKIAIMAYTLDQFAADCRAALLKLPNSITSSAHGSPTALLSQATSATNPARLEQISSGPASPSPSIGRASSSHA
jgi:hypothetical protein